MQTLVGRKIIEDFVDQQKKMSVLWIINAKRLIIPDNVSKPSTVTYFHLGP